MKSNIQTFSASMPIFVAFDYIFTKTKVSEAFVRESGFIADKLKIAKNQILKTFDGILSKVYQVMYSPSPIS